LRACSFRLQAECRAAKFRLKAAKFRPKAAKFRLKAEATKGIAADA